MYSSRKIERQTYDSIPVRFICGNHHPDHDTIANFRKRFFPQLAGLFVQILLYAQELSFGHIGQVGKRPAAPVDQVDPKEQYNFTDPEFRTMKAQNGYDQCFNAQAAVTNDMLIAGAGVSAHPLDILQLESTLDAIPTCAGEAKCLAADAGYYSMANTTACLKRGIEPYLAAGRLPHRNWPNEQLGPTDEEVANKQVPLRELTDKKLWVKS